MGGLPSRIVPNSRGFQKDSLFAVQQDGIASEERSMEPFEVVLRRSELEAWGLAWNVNSHAAKRFQVAGVDPCSPAGRWNQKQQAFGLRGICRGDELFEVNGQSGHGNMRQELVVSLVVCLLFRPVSKGPKGPEDMRRCPVLGTSLAHKDLKDVQNACHIDNTDPEPDVQPLGDQSGRRLSLSDPLPLSPEVDEADEDHEDALSEASFYSMKSSASSLSSSSQCSRNQPSSGRSCPSTDWEFQGYQCHNGQMLPPFARSISSGHVSTSSSGRGKRRRRANTANVVPPAPMPPAQQMNPVQNQIPNPLPNQLPFPPTMVPVMVPVVGAPPGQHFLAMAPMPPAMTPIAPAMAPMVPPMVSPMGPNMVSGVAGVAVSFPSEMPMEVVDMAPSQPFCAVANSTASVSFTQVAQVESQYEEVKPSAGPTQEVEQSCRVEKLEKVEEKHGHVEVDTVALKPRKKPTRRGGKRARHRPCHAAAAAEWASSVGSAETPSFGEPGSGEEAEGEEGEDEEKDDREAAFASTQPRHERHDPKAKDLPVSKPRSFYPLAARLRVASAGLKPAKKLDESRATSVIKLPKKVVEADEVELATTKEDWLLQSESVRPVRQIEVIEEVEPEPASASDVSDLPKQEPTEELVAGTVLEPVPASQRVIDLPSEQVVGRRVQITGLTKTPEFNGQWGKVEHFDCSCKRYAVQLLPAEGVPMIVKLRGENLRMPPVLSLCFKEATRKQAAWRPSLQATTVERPA